MIAMVLNIIFVNKMKKHAVNALDYSHIFKYIYRDCLSFKTADMVYKT